MSHGVLPKEIADGTRFGLAPIARALHRLGVSANAITLFGLLITLTGCALVALEAPLAALVVLLVGTLSDTLDGELARASGGGTRFGAFLDSTVDRVADAALFGAAASVGATRPDAVLLWAALVGLVASFLVSYVRAKAEAIGTSANVGLAPREARLTILLIGVGAWGVFGALWLFVAAVSLVALLSSITLLQRIAVVSRALGTSK